MPPGAGDGSRFDTGRQDVTEVAQEPQTQLCAHCGTPIEPPNEHRLYCSKRCKDNAYEARQREQPAISEQAGTAISARCQGCQKPLESTTRRPRIWCSHACRMRTRRAAAARSEEDWIPEPGASRASDAMQRRKLIRAWAEQGYSSRQMAERLGVRAGSISKIAREIGVAVPADQIIGRSHYHDSASIIRETVQALEALVMGMSLVSLDDPVDPAEAKAWATSLTGSLRVLSQFANQIKEMTQ